MTAPRATAVTIPDLHSAEPPGNSLSLLSWPGLSCCAAGWHSPFGRSQLHRLLSLPLCYFLWLCSLCLLPSFITYLKLKTKQNKTKQQTKTSRFSNGVPIRMPLLCCIWPSKCWVKILGTFHCWFVLGSCAQRIASLLKFALSISNYIYIHTHIYGIWIPTLSLY